MNNDNKVETAIAGLNYWASYATVKMTIIPLLHAKNSCYIL